MQYPVTIEQTKEGNFFVSFPDIPEALTQGETYEEALENAKDCLHTALEFYYEDWKPLPKAGPLSSDISISLDGMELLKYETYEVVMASGYTLEQVMSLISEVEDVKRYTAKINPFISTYDHTVFEAILNHFGRKLQFKIVGPEITISEKVYSYFYTYRTSDNNFFHGIIKSSDPIIGMDQIKEIIPLIATEAKDPELGIITGLNFLHITDV